MEIGQQFLEGNVVTLKSPLMVMTETDDADSNDLQIVGVVKKKVVFNSRPKPSNQVKRIKV